MKKQIPLFLVSVPLLLLYSCSKIAPENHAIVQTSTTNIILDSNTITLSNAVKIAEGFLQERKPNSIISIKDAITITKNGIPYLHVINTNNNAGFAILSADSNYTPILAYNTKGNFSLEKNDLNGGLVKWINSHGKSISYIRNNKNPFLDSVANVNKSLWKEFNNRYVTNVSNISRNQVNSNNPVNTPPPPTTQIVSTITTISNPIGPLTNVEYNQNFPFNVDCPLVPSWVANPFDGNGRWLAGCGPVAMAQIMYYWHTPNTGKYDWSQMQNTVGSGGYYIPMLLADIGSTKLSGIGNIVSIYGILNWSGGTFAQYGAGPFSIIHNANETFSDDYYAPYVFGNFGFSSASRTTSITDQMTNPINGIAYGSLLASEVMDNNRPCMITATTGQNNLGLGLLYWPYADFHTWICEGDQRWNTTITYQTIYYEPMNLGGGIANIVYSNSYTQTDFLYMNWGWGGHDNGFFYNSNQNYTQPYNSDSGFLQADLANSNFLDFQTVIYNIHL